MSAWPMADMQRQIDSVREAFSADIRKPFVLKPSFPYGSPQSSTHSSPPRQTYRPELPRSGSIDQHIDGRIPLPQVSYINHPITPPVSVSPMDSNSDSPDVQSLAMMTSNAQQPGAMQHSMPLTDAPAWNPSRIFE